MVYLPNHCNCSSDPNRRRCLFLQNKTLSTNKEIESNRFHRERNVRLRRISLMIYTIDRLLYYYYNIYYVRILSQVHQERSLSQSLVTIRNYAAPISNSKLHSEIVFIRV